MADTFLHGVEILEIDAGARPIATVRSSVIGIVGTAPDADAAAFPLNTPVLIAGSRLEAAKLDLVGDGEGTLPQAIDTILDQAGAVIVVVRVEKGATDAETLANVIGGVNATTGQYLGIQALLGAESALGVQPRIILAPGFTHTRTANGILTAAIGNAGTGYTNGTYDLVITGGAGSGAQIQAVVSGGSVTSVKVLKAGRDYTSNPTLALPAGAGSGTGAAFTLTRGTTGNAVVAEAIGVAERLRAVIIADGPNTNDADAIAYAGDFGSKRVYLVDPGILKTDSEGLTVNGWASPVAAGLLAKSDNERGFWWSPSNQTINGVIGTARAVDFTLGDPNSRANLLNEAKVATIIRQNGFRLWGNRTLSSDPKWAFLQIVRTADLINDSILRAHLWAVDRNITRTYIQDVVEGVNNYIRYLVNIGAILGGECYADPELNTFDQIIQGKVYFDVRFSGTYPAEHITFRSALVNDFIEEALF